MKVLPCQVPDGHYQRRRVGVAIRPRQVGGRRRRKDSGAALTSLDFLMHRGGIAVRAELLQLQPFSGVAAVLLGRVTGHARRPLGGVGPALGALEGDDEPDALVFCHGRTLRR